MQCRLILSLLVLWGLVFIFPFYGKARADHDFSTANIRSYRTYAFPLYFIPNKGQVNENVKFYARTPGYTLWITEKGLVFDITNQKGTHCSPGTERAVYRWVFLGTGNKPEIVPVEFTGHQASFFKGNISSQWYTGMNTSKAVLYKNLYKNIYLQVYGIENRIEYDWIVKPGADPAQIRFCCEHVTGTYIDRKGDLIITTPLGQLTHQRPVSYQVSSSLNKLDEQRRYVDVTFKKINKDTYGFEIGEYDKSRELIIDPVVLVYSTFLGGNGDDYATGLAVDSSGCAYVTGETYSTDFPLESPYQNSFSSGSRDAYVTKFSADGKSLVYSTFIGGSGNDETEGLQLDGSGQVYVTGITDSTDFPTMKAFQNTYRGGLFDAFVFILSASGSSVTYSTYLGGKGDDRAYAIALDSSKNIYITGQTDSTDYPTINAFQGTFSGGGQSQYDAFVTKIASSGSNLVYSTYIGGSGKETGWAIAVNGTNAYIAGHTTSSNFPTKNQFQGTFGGGTYDAFVSKFSSGGNSLIYSTYLGGSKDDTAWGIAVDGNGCAYATGTTTSTDFPTSMAHQSTHGGNRDIFLTKFTSTGITLNYSTYLGGTESEAAAQVRVNSDGYAYLTGYTTSTDFPVKRPYQDTYSGAMDAVAVIFNTGGNLNFSTLNFSTFLGGSDVESGKAIALDASGNVYVAGYTQSTDFPRENAYQSSLEGGKDAFVTKLDTAEFGSLCGAVDNCSLTWTTGGEAKWFEQVDDSIHGLAFYDGDAAQSGKVSASNSSYIRTTVTGPGQFSFYWRITFGYVDKLNFYMDDELQLYIMGMGGGSWSRQFCGIPEGTHTLEWVYHHSIYGSDGTCAWLDKVEYIRNTAIVLNRKQLTFGAIQGIATEPQTFSINGSVPGSLYWRASWEQSWLRVSQRLGLGNNVVTVSVNTEDLSAGTYHDALTITADGVSNSPQTVSITLNVYKPGTSRLPFGTFETPTNNSTIRSSVPFTGWVLDDVGVQSVKIYRQSGNSLIYIGDGVLVEGPRPDVEKAYPNYPFNYKAGWGYMMLTNFLPNSGNGTFTITAIATDMEGHQVKLGSKTVTLDNAHAVKPFGAIDTPTQGGMASGANYKNWGWVLTPQPYIIPIEGSTIYVWVDGVKLGNPKYNIYRSDIAALFPGYANSNGAVGYFNLDTTAFSTGIHTIQWTATDSGGNTDGLGSRYFAIENSNFFQLSEPRSHCTESRVVLPGSHPGYNRRGQDLVVDTSSPMGVVKGYQTDVTAADPEMMYPDEKGIIMVETKETDRIELHLGITGKISGWLEVDHQFRPLPPGSYLDRDKGIFYWQIGLAYVGKYKLVFIAEDEHNNQTARKVLFNILPKY